MRDEMNRNALTVTGTPVLTTGALTADTDQALTFNGTTNSASAADSTSLSMTGSVSVELFLYLASIPGSTKDIVRKTGSYLVSVDSNGRVLFTLVTSAGTTSLLSNTTLLTNQWYHIVCVYNNNYAGVQRFGNSTIGATTDSVDDAEGAHNCTVTQTALLEQGILNSVSMSLQYNDEIWPVNMQAVVYSDLAGFPDALVTQSEVLTLNAPYPAWRSPTWVNFPLTTVTVPAGTYWLGFIADTLAGPFPKLVLRIGANLTGGFSDYRSSSVGSPNNPFGSPIQTNSYALSAYCDYTATQRTGNEGKALIYINGAKNVSTSATGAIVDTANSLDVCPTVAASIDEVSIWDKPLTNVQIATHYTAH